MSAVRRGFRTGHRRGWAAAQLARACLPMVFGLSDGAFRLSAPPVGAPLIRFFAARPMDVAGITD